MMLRVRRVLCCHSEFREMRLSVEAQDQTEVHSTLLSFMVVGVARAVDEDGEVNVVEDPIGGIAFAINYLHEDKSADGLQTPPLPSGVVM